MGLPKNWVETELDNLFNLVYGKGLRVNELTEYGYPVYGANGVIGKYSDFTYEKSKVIISCRGAASGAIHKSNEKSFITSNSIVLDEYSDSLLDLDYTKYVMTDVNKTDVITGTAQPQITIQLLKNLKIPIAPLTEQKRIVAKLDALFGQIDVMKQSLERIPELLANFKQQVLTQAVSGKLTEVNVSEEELGKYLIDVKYGTSKKSSYETDGVPVFRIPNIENGEISDQDLKFSSLDEKEIAKLSLQEGDVLIIRSNGSVNLVGRSAIIRKKHVGYSYAGYLIRLRCNKDLLPNYLNYLFQSNKLREQIVDTSRSTSGVNNINSTEVKSLLILKPGSIEEQHEIVNRVECLFAKADAIESQYQNLKDKIDSLPQAILHKAFKGELVPQLPTDGDAKDLLTEIEALKLRLVERRKHPLGKRKCKRR